MKIKYVSGWLAIAAIIGIGHSVLRAQPTESQQSVKDGVYTEAQAQRGRDLIIKIGCANCHGDTLEGGPGEVPPLVGTAFLSDWEGQTLRDLANQISSMPPDSGAKRSLQENVDIMTLLLQINGYPASKNELPADQAVLGQIKIAQ